MYLGKIVEITYRICYILIPNIPTPKPYYRLSVANPEVRANRVILHGDVQPNPATPGL